MSCRMMGRKSAATTTAAQRPQTERTEVYVVPQTDFPYWFESEKKMPEEGVKLYETKLSKAEIHM